MFWGQYNLQSDVLSLAKMHLWIQFMKTIHLKEIYLLQINSDGTKIENIVKFNLLRYLLIKW